MITNREKEIILLCLDDTVKKSLDEFLNRLKISKRALQYNISNINYKLKQNIKIKNNSIIFDKNTLDKIALFEVSSIGAKDRQDLIYLYSIYSNKGLNISKLSKSINVSRNTIKSDMLKLNEKFIYKDAYVINADLKKKSEILVNIIRNKNIKIYVEELIDYSQIDKINKFLKEVSNHINLKSLNTVYEVIVCYIYNILNSNIDEKIDSFKNYKEYKLIENIYIKYYEDMNKLDKIADLLISMSLTPNIDTWINESFTLSKLIKKVSDIISVDLTKDKVFYNFLLNHIKTAIYRLKNNIQLNSLDYLSLVKENDKLIDILKTEIKDMEKVFDINFTNVEIYLLVFHFRAAIDRKENTSTKKVILVCGLGYGSSKVLESNLKEKFDIDILDILPVHLVKEYMNSNDNIDYVLTTVDLDIEAVKINPLILDEDYKKLLSLGIKLKNKKILVDDIANDIKEEFGLGIEEIKTYFLNKYPEKFYTKNQKYSNLLSILSSDKLIFINQLRDYKEAIEKVGDILLNNGSIKQEYVEAMIDNVKRLGAYIVVEDVVAMPHANNIEYVNKTDIAILILKEYIYFNDKKRAKVFFAFSSKDNKSHIDILNDFYNLIIEDDFIEQIDKIDKYEDFYKYIKERGSYDI